MARLLGTSHYIRALVYVRMLNWLAHRCCVCADLQALLLLIRWTCRSPSPGPNLHDVCLRLIFMYSWNLHRICETGKAQWKTETASWWPVEASVHWRKRFLNLPQTQIARHPNKSSLHHMTAISLSLDRKRKTIRVSCLSMIMHLPEILPDY